MTRLPKLRAYARRHAATITRAAVESDVDEIARWRQIRAEARRLEQLAEEALRAAEGGE